MSRKAPLKRLGDADLRLLRVFRVVADCGGLAASEFELNVGRSTISKHLSDLEVRLGMKLCHRGPAGFSLTAEGTRVLQASDRMLASIDQFQADVEEIHQTLTGTLKLAVFDQCSTNPDAKIHDALRAFDAAAPEVALEIAIEPPSVIEAGVIEGLFDLGIVPMHRQSSVLEYQPLYEEHMTLYCGRGHPLFDTKSWDGVDLSAHKYAGYGFNSPNMVAGQSLDLRRSARVQDEEGLALLILSGRYIGYLADHVAKQLIEAGEVRPVAPSHTRYSSRFAAIVRKRPEASRKTSEFLGCLVAVH